MSAKRPEDLFADRLDEILFDGEQVDEGDDADLLKLATRLEKAMPQVKASGPFRDNLRSQLIEEATARQKQAPVLHTSKHGKAGFGLWWRKQAYVLSSAMAVLVLAVVGIYLLQRQQEPPSMMAATPVATEPAGSEAREHATVSPDVGIALAPEQSPTEDIAAASAAQVAAFGPIQRIKPITEVPGYGLGGGGAEGPGGPIKLPAFTFPAKAISTWNLSIPLPTDLPTEANVFKLAQSENPEGDARALAAQLGFSGEPEVQEIPYGPEAGSPLQPSYIWMDGVRSLSVAPLSGKFTYNEQEGLPEPATGATAISSDEALNAAKKSLEGKGLLPPGFVLGEVKDISVQTSDDSSQPKTLMGWRVRFVKELAGMAVDGAYAEATVTATGELATIDIRNHTIGEGGLYPLRPVDSAWDEVAAGAALWVNIPPVANAIDGVETSANITDVKIGYSDDLHGQALGYLQPLYIFSGTVTNSDGQEYTFQAFATALSDESLVGE